MTSSPKLSTADDMIRTLPSFPAVAICGDFELNEIAHDSAVPVNDRQPLVSEPLSLDTRATHLVRALFCLRLPRSY